MVLGAHALDKIDHITEIINALHNRVEELENKFKILEAQVNAINMKVESIPEILDSLEQ
jgi:chaperonin cofactor prefoldin